jgi:predicted nucleic acid-binding protein
LKAFIDTNIFIYAMELHSTHSEAAGRILAMMDSGELD